ncbi:MAG: enoyl-[acyl-carrier-protein] reductase FabI [Planctomycetaceae bacterium]|nr:enoyl-[acyl-carrier-protein] reductase FabI [Planctomycetaceae bacterium]
MSSMQGKRGLVVGIANDRSYAWYITKQLLANGAQCAFTNLPGEKMERRVRSALDDLNVKDPWLMPLDASNDEDLDALFDKVKSDFGTIDFIVHSIAFADREYLQIGKFHKTTREAWTLALDISAYTLLAMAQRAVPLMTDGGSIICMSYYGGEKVVPGYNVMGIAKAALEHTTRYLAAELGEHNIRVNAISGGPLRTLAAMAVGGISEMFEHHEKRAPLRRNVEGEEVGDTAVYLLSDASRGVTGEVIHVDCGVHVIGV